MNKYYITESLGEVRKKTPEGYLLCVGVPIARTGEQEYGVQEMPEYEGRDDGIIICERPPEVVFSDETIASFEGKPFVIGHPEEGVDVTNWNQYAVGVVQNVRKGGKGDEGDLLIADILVTNAEAIADIDSGVREISCGYDGDYDQVEPGRVRLTKIIGNHVALVEAGRAGHQVAIGDEAREKGGKDEKSIMVEKKMKFWDWLRSAMKKAKDEGIVLEIHAGDEPPAAAPPVTGDEGEGENPPPAEETFDVKGAFDALNQKFDALIDAIKGAATGNNASSGQASAGDEDDPEAQTEEPDASAKTTDAKKTTDKKTVSVTPTFDARKIMTFRSAAEILAPGYDTRSITVDSAASLARAQRKVLAEAMTRDEHVRRDVELMAGCVIRSMDSVEDAAVGAMFAMAAKNKGERNNRSAKVSARDFAVVGGSDDVEGLIKTVNDFWKREGK
jgi:hypothetical protein